MDIEKIITIVSFVLAVASFAWGLFQRVKGNAAAASSELIAQAQLTGLLGSEKMALVVGQLYDMIPTPFKTFLNKEVLQNLAQRIFDYMKKYANAYIDSQNGKGKDAYKAVNDELASDVAKKLAGLGSDGLRIVAEKMGVEIDGKDDTELIKQIVLLFMEKA